MVNFTEQSDSIKKINVPLEPLKSGIETGFNKYRFEHNPLPEINFSEINTSTKFLGRELSIPLMVYSISGNSEKADRGLAELAGDYKLGFVVKDQKCCIEDKNSQQPYKIRKLAPNMLLFANLGAVYLNYGFGLDECRRAVEMIDADALMLYLNPIHEAFKPDGRKNFSLTKCILPGRRSGYC